MSDRASEALVAGFLPAEPRIYNALSKRSIVPLSTIYHRAYGRRSKEQKAQSQQYLRPLSRESLTFEGTVYLRALRSRICLSSRIGEDLIWIRML
jgi:hypothetical protein